MNIKELKDAYRAGKITKPEYIKEMAEHHAMLFEYTRFIHDTDIAKIEITDDEVIVTSREIGTRMICVEHERRTAPFEIFNFNRYEPEETAVMQRLLPVKGVFFDIGANMGWYTINFAKQLKGLKVLAFEPIPRTYNFLQRNVNLNSVENVELLNFGFSDREDELSFFYYPEGSGNASLANVSERTDVEEVVCQVRRMDDFVAERGLTPDFIKCDVEGAELMVFQGGEKILREHRPVVFTEMLRKWATKFDYHPNDMIRFFAELGYGCYLISADKLVPITVVIDDTVETNYFFLHREHHQEALANLGVELEIV
jgi:FkbM family methyltransferase